MDKKDVLYRSREREYASWQVFRKDDQSLYPQSAYKGQITIYDDWKI